MTDRISFAALCAASLLAQSSAFAATPSATFDHSAKEGSTIPVSADTNDTIRVTINNTCPADFDYAQIPSLGPPKPAAQPAAAGVQCTDPMYTDDVLQSYLTAALEAKGICKATSTDIYIKHDSKYGGYNIQISPKDGHGRSQNGHIVVDAIIPDAYNSAFKAYKDAYQKAYDANKATNSCQAIAITTAAQSVGKPGAIATVQLQSLIETVSITTATPAVELSGAFTVSNLRDPKYALSSGSSPVIVENTSAEDSRRLGAAGFIHVHNPSCSSEHAALFALCQHVAATVGLGITGNNNLSFFVGPSYRFLGQWFVTAGYNWGSIAALPASDRVGAAPSSSTVLSNLGTRNAGAFFFGLSYSFLNPGTSFFQKPFSNSPPAAATPPK
ncbi:MAG TPA: hypothetical protein VGM84_21700 [Steroidobacteraceae bacterium]